MKTLIVVSALVAIPFLAGVWLMKSGYDRRLFQEQELLQEKIGEVDSLHLKFNQLRYTDLDQRLYLPYNNKIIVKEFIDTLVFRYGHIGMRDTFVVDHTIKITRVSKW